MNKISALLQYVILITQTLIPDFRILSTNWPVATVIIARQYESHAGTLIFLNYGSIWHVSFDALARGHPRQS